MLAELRLKNLAIARDVSLSLGAGLNALSGSTGAGKSLVVEAVRWLRGEKAESSLIRAGEDWASAEAIFDLTESSRTEDWLSELGVELSKDGILTLRRELRRNGRSRAFVDGRLTSANHLRAICEHLLELFSQHQQTQIQDPSRHRSLLDDCGVSDELLKEWEIAYDRYKSCERELALWQKRREEFLAQREILLFQRRELADAQLQEGEMEQLRERVELLTHGAKIFEAARTALARLETDEGGAVSEVSSAIQSLERAGDAIAVIGEAREALMQSLELASDAARELERFLDNADFSPQALDADQARLSQLESLCRKYSRSESELLRLLEKLSTQLDAEDWEEAEPERLLVPLRESINALEQAGARLWKERRRVARRVQRAAKDLLEDLKMGEAELSFELDLKPDPEGPIKLLGTRITPSKEGPGSVRLLVRTNRGEALGPIERIASGGELSRISLVLQTLAAQGARPALLILDEVDAGVGADLGPALARRLAAMSDALQVLVITHLPAVAAAASTHLVAQKSSSGERTLARIDQVHGEERLAELSRMVGGEKGSAAQVARGLLRASRARAGS